MTGFKRTLFCIDFIPNVEFDGYTNSDTWNGFACPFFEKKVAEQVLEASKINGYSWIYDTERDVFVVQSTDDISDYEPEEFGGQTITIDDRDVKVYGIGAYSWIWGVCS